MAGHSYLGLNHDDEEDNDVEDSLHPKDEEDNSVKESFNRDDEEDNSVKDSNLNDSHDFGRLNAVGSADNAVSETTTCPDDACDWGEVGLCILLGNQPTKQCQHPGGCCSNRVHHLCQTHWTSANGVEEEESIRAVCRVHCSGYYGIMF